MALWGTSVDEQARTMAQDTRSELMRHVDSCDSRGIRIESELKANSTQIQLTHLMIEKLQNRVLIFLILLICSAVGSLLLTSFKMHLSMSAS